MSEQLELEAESTRTKKKSKKKINLAHLSKVYKYNDKCNISCYLTSVREEYGLSLLNNKKNIERGLQHLNEQTNYNPKGISFTIVNMSNDLISVEYLNSYNEWINPKTNDKGKDKFPWYDINYTNKFPKTPLSCIRQITSYIGNKWRVIYKDNIYEFTLVTDNRKNFLNKYILFFSNKRFKKITLYQLEEFIKNHIKQTSKVNIVDGLKPKWD